MRFRFPVIIIDEDFRSENISGSGIRDLAQAIEAQGMEVNGLTSFGDLTAFAQQASRASCFIVSIDDEELYSDDVLDEDASVNNEISYENCAAIHQVRQFIKAVRRRNSDIPIFLYGETRTSRHIPNDILRELHGFIHMFEDTPEFVARHIMREARVYLDSLAPPFFKALVDYAYNSSYSWHCPGHSGGVAFLKSPTGQMFHQFFGENMLRADVCNAVDELGQLLDHTGPVAASETNAARIFNADHLFFVTNGTSTSNKMVWHANVAPNDIVLVDRNCHKSILHSIMMTGAIPVFLTPTRNHYGIIGPIPQTQFDIKNIEDKIKNHPFVQKLLQENSGMALPKPKILTITQSTYDGVLYNVEQIKKNLDGYVEVLHFDEAWLPHASFHPFYHEMHAIGVGTHHQSCTPRKRTRDAMIFSTQSTHKLLAGISQASQILVQNAENNQLDRHRFNEAYLMHTSTSPQYSIIASCDIAAAMMESPGGEALVEESIAEALDFRRAMRKVEGDYRNSYSKSMLNHSAESQPQSAWWFKVWGPEYLANEGMSERQDWQINGKNNWHGFDEIVGNQDNFNMLDPIKATIITPGLDSTGEFSDLGIPAAIVTKYLAEHGIIVEKTGLYSFFIMFTIGITKGRWNSLVTELQQFKDDFDQNQPLWRVLPKFVQQHPRYEKVGLKDLCQTIHQAYAKANIAKVTTQMYLSEMKPILKPFDAWAKVMQKQVERVSIDALKGRVTAVLLTPYPPGIPLLIPGEQFNDTIIEYVKFARDFNQEFPGFETDVHGLITEVNAIGKKTYYVDCVMED
jgi:arginine decarboxylase